MALRVSTTKIAQERMTISAASPLRLELTRIMQLGINAAEQYQRSSNYQIINDSVIKGFTDAIYPVINKPIQDAIYKHTGIKLRKFIMPNVSSTGEASPAYPNAYCRVMYKPIIFSTIADLKKYFDLTNIMAYGGIGKFDEINKIASAGAPNVYISQGRFNPNINNAFSWDMCIYPGMFMAGRANVDPAGSADSIYTRVAFTAEELAAVLLHEIGHGFYMVADVLESVKKNDALVDVYARNMDAAQAGKNITPDKDLPTSTSLGAIALAHIIAEQLLKLVQISGTIVALTKLKMMLGVDNTTELLINLERFKRGGTIKALGILVFFVVVMPVLIRWACSGNHVVEAMAALSGSRKKRGETVLVGTQDQRTEEIADSFAVRHGAGAALLTGLSKTAPHLHATSATTITAKKLTSITGMISLAAGYINLSERIEPMRAASTYPETIARFALIFKEQIRVLKTMQRTPDTEEVMDQLTIAMRAANEILDRVKNDPEFQQTKEIAKIFGDENTRGTIIGGLMTGNLSNDYRKLHEALNSMSANDAYFNAEDFITQTN